MECVYEKRKRFYIIDMILMLLMLGIGIAAFYVAYLFGLLPQKWITIGAALIGVLWLIFLLLSFKKKCFMGFVFFEDALYFFFVFCLVLVAICCINRIKL